MSNLSLVEHKKYIKIKPKEYKVWSAWILEYEQYNYPEDLNNVTKLIQIFWIIILFIF